MAKRSATDMQGSAKRKRQIGTPIILAVADCKPGERTPMPFWADSNQQQPAATAAAIEPTQGSANAAVSGVQVSLQEWQPACSMSLVEKSGASDDEDVEDTATSSCASMSDDSTTAAGLTVLSDDGDSSVVPFSFGHRPCITPDVSHFETWDMVDSLLALACC